MCIIYPKEMTPLLSDMKKSADFWCFKSGRENNKAFTEIPDRDITLEYFQALLSEPCDIERMVAYVVCPTIRIEDEVADGLLGRMTVNEEGEELVKQWKEYCSIVKTSIDGKMTILSCNRLISLTTGELSNKAGILIWNKSFEADGGVIGYQEYQALIKLPEWAQADTIEILK